MSTQRSRRWSCLEHIVRVVHITNIHIYIYTHIYIYINIVIIPIRSHKVGYNPFKCGYANKRWIGVDGFWTPPIWMTWMPYQRSPAAAGHLVGQKGCTGCQVAHSHQHFVDFIAFQDAWCDSRPLTGHMSWVARLCPGRSEWSSCRPPHPPMDCLKVGFSIARWSWFPDGNWDHNHPMFCFSKK